VIIKNISPYPKTLKGLGKQLMPGDECDLSGFPQKARDDCEELQEGFRKGELICIGMGHQDVDAKMRTARARAMQNGPPQPLIEVQRGQRIPPSRISKLDEVRNPTARDENHEEPLISRPSLGVKPPSRRPIPKMFDKPTGAMERDEHGAMTIRPLPKKEVLPTLRPEPIEKKKSSPTITPERIREIMAQTCISFRTNGQKCRRWAVHGYEYCTAHMPKELMEKHKKEKKDQFFKE
jgi:hypothetical protein